MCEKPENMHSYNQQIFRFILVLWANSFICFTFDAVPAFYHDFSQKKYFILSVKHIVEYYCREYTVQYRMTWNATNIVLSLEPVQSHS